MFSIYASITRFSLLLLELTMMYRLWLTLSVDRAIIFSKTQDFTPMINIYVNVSSTNVLDCVFIKSLLRRTKPYSSLAFKFSPLIIFLGKIESYCMFSSSCLLNSIQNFWGASLKIACLTGCVREDIYVPSDIDDTNLTMNIEQVKRLSNANIISFLIKVHFKTLMKSELRAFLHQ